MGGWGGRYWFLEEWLRGDRKGGEIQGWGMEERGSSNLPGQEELGSLAPLPRGCWGSS